MAQEPDRLRREIEDTRATLTRDVDLLAEKASPRRAARRRWTAIRERVMGSADQVRQATGETASSAASTVQEKVDTVQEKAHDAADAVRSAPRAVADQAQGNPLAAGIIAFGVGMLAATLLPVTDAERRAGQELKERGSDLADRAKGVAGDVKQELAEPVRRAADEVRSTAQDAVQTTRQEARTAAQGATEQTREAARNA